LTSFRDVRHPTRRSFLATAGAALAGVASHSLHAQRGPVILPLYVADVSGNGSVGQSDQEIVETALFAQRGFGLVPRPSFDPRADVFGRGVVDAEAVEAVSSTIARYASGIEVTSPRPITVAWHYGWYKSTARPPGLQTARFKGGDYVSNDPAVETTFHDLKNEFGITVDALSWIPVRDPDNGVCQDNYRQGFLSAPNADSRYVCLLYESTIALPVGSWGRIHVQTPEVRALLRQDFAAMARFLVEIRDTAPSRVFLLDDRPVIFLFASHAWGILPPQDDQYDFIAELREVFRDVYGVPPYLVGDELFLTPTGTFSRDRELRTINFDAIYRYHHVAFKAGAGSIVMSQPYIDNQIALLRRTNVVVRRLQNRFTGRQPLIIPNMAAGFAKPGYPTLEVGRGIYADFMKRVRHAHVSEHVGPFWQGALGTAVLPAPVFLVGSWNEEFEGHTVFPFDFNLSVPEVAQHGFDLAMAIKEVFSWNHYAQRDIAVDREPGVDGSPVPGDPCVPLPCL
jgi:hypothetical protein